MTIDYTVSRLQLQLGSQDATTGWYIPSYATTSITMRMFPRGSTSRIQNEFGLFAKNDFLGCTQDPVEIGDEIYYPSPNTYYEIVDKRPHWEGDSFYWYDCDLHELPLHGYTAPTPTVTVDDPRYRTKLYLDTYLSLPSITYITAYGFPDYSLTRVFIDKGIDVVFAIEEAASTADVDPLTQQAIGYTELVPVVIGALDTEVKWYAEENLRSIVKDNPLGSVRSLQRRGKRDQHYGSTTVYMTEWMLHYRRNTA